MNPRSPDYSDYSGSAAFSALVVEPREVDKVLIVYALTSIGFRVTVTDNFRDARDLLVKNPPFAIITEVRLGEFNGLQLALRARWMHPNMPVLVTSDVSDLVLRREAEDAGATFLVKPLTTTDLLAALHRTALRHPKLDGTVEPVRPPFERRRRERRHTERVFELERRGDDQRRRDPAERLFSVTVRD